MPFITSCVRSTTVSYCFHRCVSVHTGVPHLHPIMLPLVPCPFPGSTPLWGTLPKPGQDEVPPGQVRMRYPPVQVRMGYPPLARSGWATPWPGEEEVPPGQVRMGYSPQPGQYWTSGNNCLDSQSYDESLAFVLCQLQNWIPQIEMWCDTGWSLVGRHWSWEFYEPHTFSSFERLDKKDTQSPHHQFLILLLNNIFCVHCLYTNSKPKHLG